ncbi:MAG TPA: SDR family oxidoreductase [Myxococcales bacterium]|nr:SDR family oxidoreductase [Myxococcales bacterium]
MASLEGKQAVVIGGAGDVGRAIVQALAAQGAKVRVTSRSAERLEKLKGEIKGPVEVVAGDATDPQVVARSLGEHTPDLLVIASGARPHHAPANEHTWETFSAAWDNDVKATFLLGQEVIRRPLRPGSTVVIFSSGAAHGGSPHSGGYAGAKRMQWLLASYLQGVSDQRKLGIRFVAVVPQQMIAGTEIADKASRVYSAQAGITQAAFMERFGKPLTPALVAEQVLAIARGEGPAGTAIGLKGTGMEALS